MPMSQSARSILLFSLYLLLAGTGLVVAPNAILELGGLPPTDEIWIRLLGMLVFVLGAYYFMAARGGVKPFFRWTVYGRSAGCIAYLALVMIGIAPAVFILLALVDALGALWTFLSLKSEDKK